MNKSRALPRRFRITVRFTGEEIKAIEARAARAGLKLSGYARRALVNAKPLRAARQPAASMPLLTQALARLGSIATALTAIAAKASLLPGLERDLFRSLTELRDCRVRLLGALGKRRRSP